MSIVSAITGSPSIRSALSTSEAKSVEMTQNAGRAKSEIRKRHVSEPFTEVHVRMKALRPLQQIIRAADNLDELVCALGLV